jgi:beta-lactamase regulating signal transducer with metallopeptidase domain
VLFFQTYIGMYFVQSIVHSVVTLLIVEMSLRIWSVDVPHERFRYRLQVLMLPFFMFPAFQIINPERGSFYFIEDTAIFSSMRWLEMELFGKLPFVYLFLFIVCSVFLIVIVQEIVPVVGDLLSKKNGYIGQPAGEEVDKMVDEMSKGLNIEKPFVTVINNINPVIFTVGTRSHGIVMSEPLLTMLDRRELKSALAHELAHIMRRSNFTTMLVFLIRICMFYNPVSLLEFRRLVQDDEHICDDITVAITGDAHALASALKAFCIDIPHESTFKVAELKETIERSSHNLLLHERISRLENHEIYEHHPYRWGRYVLTFLTIVAVNYFVV